MPDLPVVFENKLKKWKILSYSEDDWCNAFKNQILRFRKGSKMYKKDPYWEYLCTEEVISLEEFFKISKMNVDYWLYFDYKYLKDFLSENTNKLLQGMNWDDLGMRNMKGKDSTIWIGSKGAHTPCHADTYGCNFVAQILGRKLWILIPPEESQNLEPTRIPYEESSIYSSYNFYTPNKNLLKVQTAYKVVLKPGEVLYVPKGWWHYVENLETAISLNIWVPLDSDHESRLEEALVRHYISNICQGLTKEEAESLLNPNELDLLSSPFEVDSLSAFIETCKKFRKDKSSLSHVSFDPQLFSSGYTVEFSKFDPSEITKFIEAKCKEHKYELASVEDAGMSKRTLSEVLINSYCHPNAISLIKENLLELYHINDHI